MPTCASCAKDTAKVRCSRCKASFYCDVSCQTKDWRTHKTCCKVFDVKNPSNVFGGILSADPGGTNLMLNEVPGCSGAQKKPPEAEDFPPELREFSYCGSGDGVDENLLILLHGLGDVHKKFFQLGQKMALPQTAVLAISGPIKFPEDVVDGRAWFVAFDDDWKLIEPTKGEGRRLKSMKLATSLLESFIRVLCRNYGWTRDRIHVLGFSHGGTVALDLALRSCGPQRLGSVVAISASILPEYLMQESQERNVVCEGACSSVLITHGNQDEVLAREEVLRSKKCLRKLHPSMKVGLYFVDKDHAMVKSKEEMEYLMKFWAEHLHRRMVNMEKNSTIYEVSRR